MMLTKTLFLASGLVALSEAHMLMNTPAPYAFNGGTLNNGPMAANGADFPCKLGSGMSFKAGSAANQMALGSTQPLKFTGSAAHAGGSCQVSLTTDANPTKDSVWKVITSIEGGCPAQGQSGNLPDNAAGPDPYTYTFSVPSDIPSGNYTLAWTWFNKVGNREMYMNCAPAALTGAGGSKANFDALPDMFVANVGNGCTVPDSKDALFPNPGKNVQSLNGATDAFAAPTGTGCQKPGSGGSGAGGGGGGGGGAPATSTAPPASDPTPLIPKPTIPAPPAPTDTGVPGGVFITQNPGLPPVPMPTHSPEAPPSGPAGGPASSPSPNGPAGAPASSPSPNGPAGSAPGTAGPPSSPPSTSGSGSGSGLGVLTGKCETEGQWNCIGGKQFQQCASGQWSVAMPVAAGTKCEMDNNLPFQITAARLMRRVAMAFRG